MKALEVKVGGYIRMVINVANNVGWYLNHMNSNLQIGVQYCVKRQQVRGNESK